MTFLFKELITCGAVLSTFELVEALRELGHEAYIYSEKHNNPELEKYFGIEVIREPIGITVTVTPRLIGDWAYVRTKDDRWLTHTEPKIAVSKWIADWVGGTVIGNGTHRRFKNLGLERDIDILIEGNYEPNKNIDETLAQARNLAPSGKIVWFGRQTVKREGVETISNPSIKDIPELYNRAKTFLKMSKEEGWGRPIAEAMACGCEVINLSGGNKQIEIISWQEIAKKFYDTITQTSTGRIEEGN